MKKNNKARIYETVLAALLVALKIILDRFFAYNVLSQRFGFSFIAVACAAAMLGAPWAMLVSGLGDLLGAILFPSGPYFPGFTLTAVLTAACTAFFIRKNATLVKITLCVIINQVFGSVLLNSLWIALLYNKGWLALLPARLTQAVVMTLLQISLTWLLFGSGSPVRNRLLHLLPAQST